MRNRGFRFILLVLFVMAGVGCGQFRKDESADFEAAKAEILQADRDFNQTIADRDVVDFKSFIADDAIFYAPSANSIGPHQVAEAWAAFFDTGSGVTISWAPTDAEVSSCGDLGFTRGEYVTETASADGGMGTSSGQYVTIWRRNADGAWQAVVDIGNPQES